MRYLIVGLVTLNTLGLCWFGYQQSQRSVVYINNAKVYDAFELTTTYKFQVESFRKGRQVILDSLESNVRLSHNKLQLDSSNLLLQRNYNLSADQYNMSLQSFELEGEKMAVEYDKKIWERLNTILGDYGTEKGVDFLLGANGDGTILHARKDLDATDEVILFVNSRLKSNS